MTGRSPDGSGSRPSDRAAAGVSPVPASIPNAAEDLRKNAEALDQWMKSFDEHIAEATDPLFGRGYPLEARIADLFQVAGRLAASVHQGLLVTASAIEARRAETQGGSVEDESAVAKPDAQEKSA